MQKYGLQRLPHNLSHAVFQSHATWHFLFAALGIKKQDLVHFSGNQRGLT